MSGHFLNCEYRKCYNKGHGWCSQFVIRSNTVIHSLRKDANLLVSQMKENPFEISLRHPYVCYKRLEYKELTMDAKVNLAQSSLQCCAST